MLRAGIMADTISGQTESIFETNSGALPEPDKLKHVPPRCCQPPDMEAEELVSQHFFVAAILRSTAAIRRE